VTPPSDVAPGWHTTRLRDRAAAKPETCACCARCGHKDPAPLPEHQTRATDGSSAASCCRSAAFTPTTGAERRSDAPSGLAPIVSASKCQGLSTLWISSRTAPPPPAVWTWSPSWPLSGWLGESADLMCSSSFTPPDPPPRQSCA
jgi:hypothetical protein